MADPRDMTPEEREDFYSNMYRMPRTPAAMPTPPLPPPPNVAAGGGGDVLPQVQVPGSDTLANRYRARESYLMDALNPPKKTGWGRFGQVMGTVGQDIGNALEPNVMANIPGTTMNRRIELAQVRQRLGEEQEREALRTEAGRRTDIEQQRANVEARKAGLPTVVSGPEYAQHITDAEGNEIGVGIPYATPSATPGGLPTIQYAYPGGGGGAPAAPPTAAPSETFPTIPAPSEGAPQGGAPATPAPKVTYGTPKPPTATADEDKYLAALSVPPEQRSKAQQDTVDRGAIRFQKQTPIGDDGVRRYQDMARRAAAGTNITIPDFNAKESVASAEEKIKNLQTNVTPVKTMQREQTMLQQREDEKDRRTQVLSIDPNDNQLKLTSRYNAVHSWNDPDPQTVTGAQLASMRNELPRLNDVQMNFSNYIKAYRDQRQALAHPDAVKRIMAGVSDEDARAMSYLTLGAFSHMMEQGEVSNAWNKLDPNEQALVSGYLRSKGSLVAYNYTVSGTARGAASPTVLAIDVATLPTPDVGATIALPRLQTFQENLDVLASKYPTNLTGIKTPDTYKKKIEGTQQLPPGATEYVPKR